MSFAFALDQFRQGRTTDNYNPSSWNRAEIESLVDWGSRFLSGESLFSSSQMHERAADLETWRSKHVARFQRRAAYLDTTTLHSVRLAVEESFLQPASLVDLNTFANAVVLFDHVVHLENRWMDSRRFNSVLGPEVVATVPVQSFQSPRLRQAVSPEWEGMENCVEGLMSGIWTQARDYVTTQIHHAPEHAEDLVEMKSTWKTLTGIMPRDREIADRSYLHTTWGSPGRWHIQMLLDPTRVLELEGTYGGQATDIEGAMTALFTETNCRYVFNTAVGFSMDLLYLPNSFRVPFSRQFIRRRSELLERYTGLLNLFDGSRQVDPLASSRASDLHLDVPLILSAILARIDRPEQFYEELAGLRRRARGFRAKKAELEDALRRGEETGRHDPRLRALVRAMNQDVTHIIDARILAEAVLIGAGAVAGAQITNATWPVALSLAAIALTPTPGGELAQRAWERIRRPELRFAAHLGHVSGAVRDNFATICHIWGLDRHDPQFREQFFRQFEALAAV